MRRSLAFVLTDPLPAQEQRVTAAAVGVPELAWQQAQMQARDGGLQLPGAVMQWAAAHLAGALRCLPFLQSHAAAYCLDGVPLADAASPLPYFHGLRAAAAHLQAQVATPAFPLDLASLLSGSPRSLHDLSEGVFASLRDTVLSWLTDERHAARLLSAGGLHAGAGLSAIPVTAYLSGRARHYQIMLRMRLGLPLLELLPVGDAGPFCGGVRGGGGRGCGEEHDECGFHPGVCRVGNRLSLWTHRHDAVEQMLVFVLRRIGVHAVVCSRGSGNWLGAAAVRPGGTGYRRADIVLPHRFGPGRHLFLDVAVTDPAWGKSGTKFPKTDISRDPR